MSITTLNLHEKQTGKMLEISIHTNMNKNVTCLQHIDTLCNSCCRIYVC